MLSAKTILAGVAVLSALSCPAVALDFRTASIVISPNASAREKKAAILLSEEIQKRTQLKLKVDTQPGSGAVFLVAREDHLQALASGMAGRLPVLPKQTATSPESFTVVSSRESGEQVKSPVAVVSGKDDRGVIFGAGYLLRSLHMGRQRLELDAGLNVTTAPKVPMRGHQLGYRPKTNAYDAWSVPVWEQYIRELAIFGTNTIELMPPRTDDAPDSPHFPLPQIDMMVEMSRIADEYGMNVSIWYPALDQDYSDPKTVELALKEWGEVFRRLPRVDEVFVPGGDPGHTPPKLMMALLEKQTANLRKYHPNGTMWMSPQGFTAAWMDEFYTILKSEPAWLQGLVFGPQNFHTLSEFRGRTPKRYPIRYYPDITHMFHAQYPVRDWDSAFTITEGREVINPRPLAQRAIFKANIGTVSGFITYSEGCNDDVNKFLWSGLGWNPDADVRELLVDYSRFLIGEEVAQSFANGLMALERNWQGPLLTNTGIETTLQQFRDLENQATPQMRANWRFQQAQYRANYDAFLRARLIIETNQEQRAMSELAQAARNSTFAAMAAAETQLNADRLTTSARDLRARVFELAEALFQSIRMQLSVPRYQAIAIGRGANLDAIDFSLNNRIWLLQRFQEIRQLKTEEERLAKVNAILHWTDPGPGGFYDDPGDPLRQPHVVAGQPYEQDPDFRHSPMIGFSNRVPEVSGSRISWYNHAEGLYETPLRMKYTGLDPKGKYRLRVVYGGDAIKVPIRLVANGGTEIHPFLDKPSPIAPLEFDIPAAATRGGALELEWTRPAALGSNGRGAQVSEVWLMPAGAQQTASK